MLDFILWYGFVTLLGWLVFPALFRLAGILPDRGYSLSKIFGLLVWGYLHWILGRLGLTANNHAGLLLAFLLSAGLGLGYLRVAGWDQIRSWLNSARPAVLATEVVFLAAFAGWALIRSLNPEIVGTEKPMELAFINAIMASDTLPPNDPWLSGYAISYYYFGFILVAMLAKLAGSLGSVAFNLGVALTFGLAAVGSFGLLHNLLQLRPGRRGERVIGLALLGPLFTLILSNWEGFLHFLHARGIFQANPAAGTGSAFWNWLDIQDLTGLPAADPYGHWWWWRASRVIQDYDFTGFGKEVISEFPFFSFLLGDLHPHVLSLPYVYLLLGFALVVYLKPDSGNFRWLGVFHLQLPRTLFWVLAWLSGSMAFLNTWNFPMYVGIIAGAYVLRRHHTRPVWEPTIMIRDFLGLGISLGLTGGLLFLPWYLGFASQAGGVIPNVLYITRGNQFWVMFGPLLVPIFGWLLLRWVRNRSSVNLTAGLTVTGILIGSLLLLMSVLVGLLFLIPLQRGDTSVLQLFLGSVGGTELSQVFQEGLLRRLVTPGTTITLAALSILSWGLVFFKKGQISTAEDAQAQTGWRFVLLLVLGGTVLVLIPEFVFLRDLFGYRINTIFKFYYQAWLMWSLAAAFSTAVLLEDLRKPGRLAAALLAAIAILMGLFYPVLSLPSKTNNFRRPDGMTLDGTALFPPSDYQGIEWLREAPQGVIVEAVGSSYSTAHSRMSTYTGYPTILGWDFHEIQWRGGSELVMPRKSDLAEIYCGHQWELTRALLEKYHASYLVVGEIEFSTYNEGSDGCPAGLKIEKFFQHLPVLYQNERLTIFGIPETGRAQ